MRSYRQWLVFSKAVLALLLLAGVNSAPFAAVNVDRTRLVFAANDIAQSLTLANDSVTPMLLQVWTDAGETASSPDNSRTPLVVLPPVFKMQPDELRTGEPVLAQHLPDTARTERDEKRYPQASVTPTAAVESIYSSDRLKGAHRQ